MAMQFTLPEEPHYLTDDAIDEINENPGFGTYFTDHMAVANWTIDDGWTNSRLMDYTSFSIPPASAVFHYAQEVFEGLKAYRRQDDSIWLFRPEANAARFRASARRLALPELPEEDFLASIRALVDVDARWVPRGNEQSLYLRPFMIANENYLGVRPAHTVNYCVIASPVGAYFPGGVQPVSIWVSTEFSRVPDGGTGEAKCGGNYASSLAAQRFADEKGCSQVLFLDAATKTYVEELGGMNFFFVTKDDELVTPELNGNILRGVTRDSILTIAPEMGLRPCERKVEIAEVFDGVNSGHIRSMFACGTAAVVTPIDRLSSATEECSLTGDLSETLAIRDYLLDLQYGRREDTFGWTQQVC